MSDLSTSKTFLDVMNEIKKYIKKQEDIDFIFKAFDFASAKHFNQFRKSGEPYINHAIEVAYILAYYQSSPVTIASGLLHDVIEDCGVTEEIIVKEFGHEVADIVIAVTKIERLPTVSIEESAAASHRKLIIAMAKDVRAIIVKLSDRLHNMRTLKYHNQEKRRSIAQETLDVYSPLAHRLGMNELKNELENLSLYYLEPDKYREVEKLLESKNSLEDSNIDALMNDIDVLLKDINLEFKVYGRTKHIYSIYKKVFIKGTSFEQIFDLHAVRIITQTITNCYEILGYIHTKYRPIPGRFKDYIAMPKPNMYQSLHTTIIDTKGNIFEVQIRTEEMENIAEKGIAAHFIYKENDAKDSKARQKLSEEKLHWFRDLISLNEESTDQSDNEYMANMQKDIFEANVYALTPNGKVIDLPSGATPIDFAYRIHTEVGNNATGAIVNKMMVPLNTVLKTGDVVEIKTSKTSTGPKDAWLKFVKTSTAKSFIKKAIAKREQAYNTNVNEGFYKKGLQLFDEAILNGGFDKSEVYEFSKQISVINYFQASNFDELILFIGRKSITASAVVALAINSKPSLASQIESVIKKTHQNYKGEEGKSGIMLSGTSGLKIDIASCCQPIPGDDIVGFIGRGSGVKIHLRSCPNIAHERKRIIAAAWPEDLGLSFYSVNLEITANDRNNLLSDVMAVFSQAKIRVDSLSAKVHYETKIAALTTTIFVSDLNHLEYMMGKIRQVNGVYAVRRLIK